MGLVSRATGWYFGHQPYDDRLNEYKQALRFFEGCHSIVDVACGTGTFMEAWKGDSKGVDINPDNVAYCRARGLDAVEGSALELPFENNSFDGAHCSHLMQVFTPDQAVSCIRELCRVVRDNGVVVITTLNWFDRFFRHPENVRPYPPDALRRLVQSQSGATSPMWPDIPYFTQEDIWLRHPPLIEFVGKTAETDMWIWRLNPLQLRFGLRRYWEFDAYTVKLRVEKRLKEPAPGSLASPEA
jgi:SAM-dependent methyltransferase